MHKRKIIVYIATSADGYIARPGGDVSWLNRPRIAGNYGMDAFYRSIDTILWGRTTYDEAVRRGMAASGFGGDVHNFVFTHRAPATAPPGIEFVSEGVSVFARRLRRRSGKHIWMMGGAEIIGSFLDVGAIDEFMIHVIPTLIGQGIPLIAPKHRMVRLLLLSTRQYKDGVVRLHYAVDRRPGRGRQRRRTRPR